ncbi:MAG TPA: hypothetical protein ENG03_07290 [Thioploca sp.]|nr:hypothetical protein [Thioploca sp.]
MSYNVLAFVISITREILGDTRGFWNEDRYEILGDTEGFCHFYYARNLEQHQRLLSFLLREKSWTTVKLLE